MIYMKQSLYGDALECYKLALDHQMKLEYSNNNALAEIYNNICTIYIQQNHYSQALIYCQDAENALLHEPHNKQQLSLIYSNKGRILFKLAESGSDPEQAANSFHKAYEMFEKSSKNINHDALEQRLMKADFDV
ncbi:unnamed protein product [Didymodactylos carnosus]|uniref:Tetratricopeptide repeat protein n=1 Tax=Didymodactylos carnosus TaxID=1234261 RepID=A0A816A415_9BILA|nr:unnamed protein product [Didymodactylos carnosus]CAF1591759.1 unnamed protein product [Didymodactylos carnosus]CAF4043145.1 unnamed protein product [Didymodactylos carnosus]CAF4464290.1 unnamed protein product [Didymodactylos carnosus]